MKDVKRSAEFDGTSSTGSRHGLLIEESPAGIRVTITGHNGKRHAAVLLPDTAVAALAEFITPEGR